MKIIHFSDIHTGGHLSSISSLFDKRIIGTLNYKLRRKRHIRWERLDKAIKVIEEEKPDFVINTGDITSVSEPGEFEEALERLKPITENDSFEFINVPGNHDYYVDNPVALEGKFNTYNKLNRNKLKLDEFPIRLERENCIFILLDESRPNGGTKSSGILKPEDFEKVQKWLNEPNEKPVILVGHYPLKNKLGEPLAERRALENGELLSDLLEKGKISVNLCGHIHAAFMREEQSGSIEICAGSLTIGGRMNKLEFNCETNSFSQSWIELK